LIYGSILKYSAAKMRENRPSEYDAGFVTHEFLRSLAEYLEPNEALDIQTAGFTKRRLPVLAKRYVVRDADILHADLGSPDLIDG